MRIVWVILVVMGVRLTARAEERLNVLWIVADDLGVELGCYGEPGVTTPNMDRLAAEGMKCTNAFSTSPVCSPTRTAFILGMYQTTVGGHHHLTREKPVLPDGVRPVTELFRQAGYFVTNGSVTLQSDAGPAESDAGPAESDAGPAESDAGPADKAPAARGGLEFKRGKTHYNFLVDEKRMFDGIDWRERAEGQPFFAQVQIGEPHRAFPVVGDDVIDAAEVRLPPFYPDHPVLRVDWRNYLAAVQVADEKVGAVLDRLEADGLADNTLVMLFGDHGRPHLRGKQWLYEGGIKVPLIVRWPGRVKAGEEEPRLVSLIDVAPASLAAAGLETPDHMHGEDFLAKDWLGREVVFAARDRCGDAMDRIRCVRGSRFKYIRNYMPEVPYMVLSSYKKLGYPAWAVMEALHEQGKLNMTQRMWMLPWRSEEELYDLQTDPHELVNVADYDENRKVLKEMRARLDEWEETTKDRGRVPEGDKRYLQKIVSEKRAWYLRTMKERGLNGDVTPEYYVEWWERELGLK